MKLEDLQAFCIGPEAGRESLERPFTRGEFTYASDGVIAVRVRGAVDGVGQDQFGVHVEKVFAPAVGLLVPIPVVDLGPEPVHEVKTCTTCQGHGRVTVTDCTACKGKGEIVCGECGHDDECKVCEGSGIGSRTPTADGPVECDDCDGTGDENHDVVQRHPFTVLGFCIDRPVLKKLMTLPGIEIDSGGNRTGRSPVYFAFDGGEGMFMPMLQGDAETAPAYRPEPAAAEPEAVS